ncbi:MAG: hypothetical protein NPIRA05_22840 [Nitrospirales bacterium]|nr:MAG: hypothetical protein NPIRA05_22840 [Nitrospirales bacterium]
MVTEHPNSVWRKLEKIALIGLALSSILGMEVKGQELSAEKGKGLYQRLCSTCHGKAGTVDRYGLFDPPPADLKDPATQKKTDEELLNAIRNGHPNTAMGNWEYALSGEEMKDVLAYIRTLWGTTS